MMNSSTKLTITVLWIVSVIVAGVLGFAYGNENKNSQTPIANSQKSQPIDVVNKVTNQLPATTIQTNDPTSTPAIVNNNVCKKSGLAQKWEYLVPYTLKANDSYQNIAKSQLNDESRVNEIMQINGISQLVVGATLYLPPPSITKSSGNIQMASGRLVKKDSSGWQLSFNGDISGQSIIIPSFWFGEIANRDSYKIGDCLTILFDNGYKVFSVSNQ
jgi:hypothetical protein